MTIKKIYLYLLAVCVACSLAACEKEEDPFVDRVASPVLVVIQNSSGYLAGGGLYSEPVVSAKLGAPVVLSAKIYELDKSGLLSHTVGIDSIPVANLSVALLTRTGTKIADLVSDSEGTVTITKTWDELGIAAPQKGTTLSLDWTGEYKGIGFARRSQLQAIE
ncbi:hypothetical protein Q0590_27195 [Rhodocytophaga aerolata]|uniref:DUF3124 domain-containing protein n=1 Tax=Rhodocytophaga aerolata TaxID=455078 RepID=A0ABT8RE83_9BACT|nr:hypothetical protein [Rhodocytophaga aerolata]MDO1449996.1 hypothetical protein [Rhodocytophaga aerolata]